MSVDTERVTAEVTDDVPATEPAQDEPAQDELAEDEPAPDEPKRRRVQWSRVLAYAVLPGLAIAIALGAGFLKWQDDSAQASQEAAVASVQAATESTIAMLAYQPDTVDQQLGAAADRLTGTFRDEYTQLVNDVVIPGSKEQRIAAVATVPAAASESASENHAVVLVFVNQTTTIGNGTPSDSLSTVRVSLDKVGDRWLVSQFEPV